MIQTAAIAWSLFERAQVGITRYTKDIAGDDWYARPRGPDSHDLDPRHLAVYRDMALGALTGQSNAPSRGGSSS